MFHIGMLFMKLIVTGDNDADVQLGLLLQSMASHISHCTDLNAINLAS
jgi:hypothetical protein